MDIVLGALKGFMTVVALLWMSFLLIAMYMGVYNVSKDMHSAFTNHGTAVIAVSFTVFCFSWLVRVFY